MTRKRRYLIFSIFLLIAISATLYFTPDLILGGKILYKIGATRLESGDHGDYHDEDKVASAIYYLEKAVKKGYNRRELFDKLSYCYLISDDNRNAERIFTIGLTHYPEDVEFYFDRGNCRKKLRNYNGAFIDFDKVVTTDKSFKHLNDAIYYRGAMSYILGDTVKANIDRQEAQKITNHELRTYADYCQLWK